MMASINFNTQVAHMERVHGEMPRQYRHDDLGEGVKVVSF